MIFIQMKQKTTKQKERKHFLLVTQNKGEQIYEDQTDLFKFVQKDLNFGCAGKKKKKIKVFFFLQHSYLNLNIRLFNNWSQRYWDSFLTYCADKSAERDIWTVRVCRRLTEE